MSKKMAAIPGSAAGSVDELTDTENLTNALGQQVVDDTKQLNENSPAVVGRNEDLTRRSAATSLLSGDPSLEAALSNRQRRETNAQLTDMTRQRGAQIVDRDLAQRKNLMQKQNQVNRFSLGMERARAESYRAKEEAKQEARRGLLKGIGALAGSVIGSFKSAATNGGK